MEEGREKRVGWRREGKGGGGCGEGRRRSEKRDDEREDGGMESTNRTRGGRLFNVHLF